MDDIAAHFFLMIIYSKYCTNSIQNYYAATFVFLELFMSVYVFRSQKEPKKWYYTIDLNFFLLLVPKIMSLV